MLTWRVAGQAYTQAPTSLIKDTPSKGAASASKKKGTPKPAEPKSAKKADDKEKGAGSKAPTDIRLNAASREILGELLQSLMGMECGKPFSAPVTPDIAPDYLDVIKFPMDLGLVKSNLDKGRYLVSKSFVRDVKLVVENALAYNQDGDDIYNLAKELEKEFESKWAEAIPAVEEAAIGSKTPGSCLPMHLSHCLELF